MWAHIQTKGQCEKQCSGLIRIFEDGQTWGDPYRYAFPFVMVDDTTIEVVGIVGRAPTPSEYRAGMKAVRERGWRVVRDRKSGARQGLRDITRERV